MKYLFKILATFLIASSTYAQTGKGTTTPHASAQLEVSSTTKRVFVTADVTSRKGCYSKPGYRRLLNRSSQLVLYWRDRVSLRISHGSILE
jgi:hypothetical protein